MGKTDAYQSDYLEDNVRFADQINGALFKGKQVVKPEELLKEYVTNYKLNIYDCHEHDTFEEYHTGLRQLFEIVRYFKDKEQFGKVIEENRESYSRMDGDTRELVEVVTGIKISDECEAKEAEGMESGEKMYNAWEAQKKMENYDIVQICKAMG